MYRRTEQIRHREEEIALRLVAAAEYRDNETGAHIRRLGLCSAVLAEAAGCSRDTVDEVRLAATMHDIGKIGIPDHILLKPGKLHGRRIRGDENAHDDRGSDSRAIRNPGLANGAHDRVKSPRTMGWNRLSARIVQQGYPRRSTDRFDRRCLRRTCPRASL